MLIVPPLPAAAPLLPAPRLQAASTITATARSALRRASVPRRIFTLLLLDDRLTAGPVVVPTVAHDAPPRACPLLSCSSLRTSSRVDDQLARQDPGVGLIVGCLLVEHGLFA